MQYQAPEFPTAAPDAPLAPDASLVKELIRAIGM